MTEVWGEHDPALEYGPPIAGAISRERGEHVTEITGIQGEPDLVLGYGPPTTDVILDDDKRGDDIPGVGNDDVTITECFSSSKLKTSDDDLNGNAPVDRRRDNLMITMK